jgi:adenosylhomocysteine nucleosidase
MNKLERIGIICAMEDEARIIINKYRLEQINNKFFKIYSWKAYNKEIILLVSKIWKVYSSIWTTYLIQNFEIEKLINIWLAGWLTKEKEIWKTFQATKVIQHDAFVPWDWEHLNYFQGEIKLEKIENKSIKTWTCLTWDQFIDDKVECKKLSEKWDIVEMEAYAIASVAQIFNKPLLILKSISDNASVDAKWDFYENLKLAMNDWVQTMDKILEKNLF